jgi:hypothetical protein
MENTLEVRRVQLVRDLIHVNRQIALTQKNLAEIERRLTAVKEAQQKAA